MKSLLILLALFSQLSYATEYENIQYSCSNVENHLDDSEQSEMYGLIDQIVVNDVFKTGYANSSTDVFVEYSCIEDASEKVICHVMIDITSDLSGSLVVIYDRVIGEFRLARKFWTMF